MQVACRLTGIILTMLALTACNFDADMGFVEIRTVPVAAPAVDGRYITGKAQLANGASVAHAAGTASGNCLGNVSDTASVFAVRLFTVNNRVPL